MSLSASLYWVWMWSGSARHNYCLSNRNCMHFFACAKLPGCVIHPRGVWFQGGSGQQWREKHCVLGGSGTDSMEHCWISSEVCVQQRSRSLKRTSDLLGEQWYRMLQLLSEEVPLMLGRSWSWNWSISTYTSVMSNRGLKVAAWRSKDFN